MNALERAVRYAENKKQFYNFTTVIDLKTKYFYELSKQITKGEQEGEYMMSELDAYCFKLLEIEIGGLSEVVEEEGRKEQKMNAIYDSILQLRKPLEKQNFKQFTKLNYALYKMLCPDKPGKALELFAPLKDKQPSKVIFHILPQELF